MTNKITFVLLVFSSLFSFAQTLIGTVIDVKTKKPLETVSVYFDNTTIGTTTNEKGEFSIDYNDAVQSTLVISFLGYDKQYISDYRNKTSVIIKLNEAVEQLDEVVINMDDGMSRTEKLRWFRKEFLGESKYGKSCKILNEKDLRFRYNKRTRTLTAWSNKPIIVRNKKLQYEISFDIIDFELTIGRWNGQSVTYSGTTFFKDLDEKGKKKTLRNREKAYNGSVQHFMRALYNKDLAAQNYVFGKKGFIVKPYDFFTISKADKEGLKSVKLLDNRIDIFYKDIKESLLETTISEFQIDKYGNYMPIQRVLFGGYLGGQRIGDILPLDYNFDKDEEKHRRKPFEVLTEGFIEGSWHVVSIEKEPTEKPYSFMIDSFKKATFRFNSDKSLKIESTVPNSLFTVMSSFLDNATWEVTNKNNISYINISSNGISQMKIRVNLEAETVFFNINDEKTSSYFSLKMRKQ